jgi:hypothetical protein
MGHRQDMTDKQRREWDSHSYRLATEARRGHSFEYWNDDKHEEMLKNGWSLYQFSDRKLGDWYQTISEESAKEVVEKLRSEGNYARIVCGYNKNVQRIKMHSVIFKPK